MKISEPNNDALPLIATAVSAFGRFYNGFEAKGVENIPKEGPALLVFYHCLNPLDAWYFGLQYYLDSGRLIRGLGDRFLFKTPGLAWLCRTVGGVPGSRDAALKLLKDGNLVGVSPGGVREAIKGTSNRYKLVWNNHVGFARVALDAGVDIIPCFTQNSEEMYRAPFAEHPLFQKLFEITKLPLVPMYGLGLLPFPVKLTAWIGKPIKIQKGETPESLRSRTEKALVEMIEKHQDKNQTVLSALGERFFSK